MPGVVFIVVVPTAKYEVELLKGLEHTNDQYLPSMTTINSNDNNDPILRLEVELRDKNIRQRPMGYNKGVTGKVNISAQSKPGKNYHVPMEKVLGELLTKLEIEHVNWTTDNKGHYNHIVFPLPSGNPCETALHCLTELGIGKKFSSNVSVLPCSVSYDAIKDNLNEGDDFSDDEEYSKWNQFVDSIKSKLTVKQVVDGVRTGGSISFDYILLIITADSLAALGLVENNAPNITAAMLVSPLMGPVMSITFGAIISDHALMKMGFAALGLGMLISLIFGFVFGLILGTTEMPWGFGDWPTEEMKGRGNARSLWMGVMWALTSGTGVAVALLQGSAGPLIGVAISASLLPPVVNCGLFWSMACIWLIYENVKIPHIKGESYVAGNTSYVPLYTNYIPTEFFICGIVSAMLTVVNVICIFITAIIILKIKEVAAPYTSSPNLRRFWETDIRTVRKTNRSTLRRKGYGKVGYSDEMNQIKILSDDPRNKELGTALEEALRQAVDDDTFKAVKRMSYSSNSVEEAAQRFGIVCNNMGGNQSNGTDTIQNTKLNVDLSILDKLVSSLLERPYHFDGNGLISEKSDRKNSMKLNRLKSRSMKDRDINNDHPHDNIGSEEKASNTMPTIFEVSNHSTKTRADIGNGSNLTQLSGVQQILNAISSVPKRFSGNNNGTSSQFGDEECANLTKNILD